MKSFKSAVKKTALAILVMGLLVGFGAYLASARNLKALEGVQATSSPKTLDSRWEENFKKDIELEMQRPGFQVEMNNYAYETARNNVLQSYITKLEQKVK